VSMQQRRDPGPVRPAPLTEVNAIDGRFEDDRQHTAVEGWTLSHEIERECRCADVRKLLHAFALGGSSARLTAPRNRSQSGEVGVACICAPPLTASGALRRERLNQRGHAYRRVVRDTREDLLEGLRQP
jgi:hypothetical protein